jgi:hypothetical protein
MRLTRQIYTVLVLQLLDCWKNADVSHQVHSDTAVKKSRHASRRVLFIDTGNRRGCRDNNASTRQHNAYLEYHFVGCANLFKMAKTVVWDSRFEEVVLDETRTRQTVPSATRPNKRIKCDKS